MNTKTPTIMQESLLFDALSDGDFKKFCLLIEFGENINCVSVEGKTLISCIVENKFELKNNRKFFDKLMSLNVSLQNSKNKCDILTTAIKYQPDIYYMDQLLKKGINVNSTFYLEYVDGQDHDDIFIEDDFVIYGPPIFEAISCFDSKKIDLLLEYKPDLEMCNSNNTPLLSFLMFECYYKPNIIDHFFPILIKKGASITETDLDGKQPIHCWAAYNGNIKNFNLLIKNKININAKDKHGNTPLMDAALNDIYKSASILIKNNADLNLQNKDGRTAIMNTMAFYTDSRMGTRQDVDINMINLFLKPEYNLLLCDNNLENIAHYLARCPKEIWDDKTIKKYSKLFIKHPKLISQKNIDGNTPMDILKNKSVRIYSKFTKLIEKDKTIEK